MSGTPILRPVDIIGNGPTVSVTRSVDGRHVVNPDWVAPFRWLDEARSRHGRRSQLTPKLKRSKFAIPRSAVLPFAAGVSS